MVEATDRLYFVGLNDHGERRIRSPAAARAKEEGGASTSSWGGSNRPNSQ